MDLKFPFMVLVSYDKDKIYQAKRILKTHNIPLSIYKEHYSQWISVKENKAALTNKAYKCDNKGRYYDRISFAEFIDLFTKPKTKYIWI